MSEPTSREIGATDIIDLVDAENLITVSTGEVLVFAQHVTDTFTDRRDLLFAAKRSDLILPVDVAALPQDWRVYAVGTAETTITETPLQSIVTQWPNKSDGDKASFWAAVSKAWSTSDTDTSPPADLESALDDLFSRRLGEVAQS